MSNAQEIQVLFATYAVAFNNLFDKICDLEDAIKKLAKEGSWTITAQGAGSLTSFGRTVVLLPATYAMVINLTGSRTTEFNYGAVQNVIEGGWISFAAGLFYLPRVPLSFGQNLIFLPEYERYADVGITAVAIGIPPGVTGSYFQAKRVFTPTPAPTPAP